MGLKKLRFRIPRAHNKDHRFGDGAHRDNTGKGSHSPSTMQREIEADKKLGILETSCCLTFPEPTAHIGTVSVKKKTCVNSS